MKKIIGKDICSIRFGYAKQTLRGTDSFIPFFKINVENFNVPYFFSKVVIISLILIPTT